MNIPFTCASQAWPIEASITKIILSGSCNKRLFKNFHLNSLLKAFQVVVKKKSYRKAVIATENSYRKDI